MVPSSLVWTLVTSKFGLPLNQIISLLRSNHTSWTWMCFGTLTVLFVCWCCNQEKRSRLQKIMMKSWNQMSAQWAAALYCRHYQAWILTDMTLMFWMTRQFPTGKSGWIYVCEEGNQREAYCRSAWKCKKWSDPLGIFNVNQWLI